MENLDIEFVGCVHPVKGGGMTNRLRGLGELLSEMVRANFDYGLLSRLRDRGIELRNVMYLLSSRV